MSDDTTAMIMSAAFPRDVRHEVMAVNEIVPVPRRDSVGSFAVVSVGEPLVIILDFEGQQVEICHQKFNDLSITFNTVDCGAPILGWEESELSPTWRFDDARLAGFHGLLLRQVALLQWHAPRDLADGMVAVEFGFDNNQFVITNALDENTIEIGRRDAAYRAHHLTPPPT